MALYRSGDLKRNKAISPKGKSVAEKRKPFRRDYARIIHSHAFRRLQGKTQLFPGFESDFFRNRLTHSLEVAQFAKAIANAINREYEYFKKPENNIDLDLVEVAALAHDLGHPPFGHNGEKALNDLMYGAGGFEGNAQTLRILAKIEKREKGTNRKYGITLKKEDKRYGYNLTFRSLASILKYDVRIPLRTKKLVKGYYRSEYDLVREIKANVTQKRSFKNNFKTLECYIMEIADDIAYSTYDLEDAFKTGFLSAFEFIDMDSELAEKVKKNVNHNLSKRFSINRIKEKASSLFINILYPEIEKIVAKVGKSDASAAGFIAKMIYKLSDDLCKDGYARTNFTSRLVEMFITDIDVDINFDIPCLSKVYLRPDTRLKVEILKQVAYISLINSPRLKIAAYRSNEILGEIFSALSSKKGFELLPNDYRDLYLQVKKQERKRIICDFIAGMTDRYALEFYGRLKSEHPQTIFKPF